MGDSGKFPVEDLDAIRPPDGASECSQDDTFRPLEIEKLDIDFKKQQLREVTNNNNLREALAKRLWCLVVICLIVVMVIIILSGIQHDAFPFFPFLKYEPSVLIALITTTTASVLGLLIIFLNYLYPSDGPKPWSTIKPSPIEKE
jgi:hypothetical protein